MPDCKHNQGFRFYRCDAADRLPGVWICLACHEYGLNFNPETYPDCIACVNRPIMRGDKVIAIVSSKVG